MEQRPPRSGADSLCDLEQVMALLRAPVSISGRYLSYCEDNLMTSKRRKTRRPKTCPRSHEELGE